MDWASVLVLARQNAKVAGVEARYTTIAGSAFEVDWGKDYDLVLLPNFLHHFDVATCTALLKKVRASLTPDGFVIVVEYLASEDESLGPVRGRILLQDARDHAGGGGLHRDRPQRHGPRRGIQWRFGRADRPNSGKSGEVRHDRGGRRQARSLND